MSVSVIETLVVDRTKADVDRWQALHDKGYFNLTASEKAEWLAGMKGAYNASDLNRVGQAMQYLSERFRTYGYISAVTARVDWTMTDIPVQTDMEAYLSDVRHLRGLVAMLTTTPQTPASMELLTWSTANDIEKILADIEDTLGRMRDGWFYSGELFSGEV